MSQRERRALDALHDRAVNFDPIDELALSPGDGWTVDRYCERLPGEPPGEPLRDGPFAVARDLMRNYEFADPRMVRAVFRHDVPLEGRNMLLEIRFFGLRFFVGCRVGAVTDEIRRVDGRAARVWGWNYRTLEGHLESGQMDWELWKWLDDGGVEFHIHVVSRATRIHNPVVRLGFRLVGRSMQVRFASRACARMRTLTEQRVAGGSGPAAAQRDQRPPHGLEAPAARDR